MHSKPRTKIQGDVQCLFCSPSKLRTPTWSSTASAVSWLKNDLFLIRASPLLCLNASQCHFFFCKKRKGPDLLSGIVLRARKELSGYHFAQEKLSMDAEEEDREVVNMHSARRATQVDVSPTVTSTKAHSACRIGCLNCFAHLQLYG